MSRRAFLIVPPPPGTLGPGAALAPVLTTMLRAAVADAAGSVRRAGWDPADTTADWLIPESAIPTEGLSWTRWAWRLAEHVAAAEATDLVLFEEGGAGFYLALQRRCGETNGPRLHLIGEGGRLPLLAARCDHPELDDLITPELERRARRAADRVFALTDPVLAGLFAPAGGAPRVELLALAPKADDWRLKLLAQAAGRGFGDGRGGAVFCSRDGGDAPAALVSAFSAAGWPLLPCVAPPPARCVVAVGTGPDADYARAFAAARGATCAVLDGRENPDQAAAVIRAALAETAPNAPELDGRALASALTAVPPPTPMTPAEDGVQTELDLAPPRPRISVCMATFNRAQPLAQAVAALAAQNLPPQELVIVDDGGSDPAAQAELAALPARHPALNIKIIRQDNAYLGAARNAAAQAADPASDWLLFCDDDNIAKPDLLDRLVAAQAADGADIVLSLCDLFQETDADGRPIGPTRRRLFAGPALEAAPYANIFGDANALVRRSLFERLGGFTTDYAVTHEDWEFFLRAAQAGGSLLLVPEALFWYRDSADSMIHNTAAGANFHRILRSVGAATPDATPAALGDAPAVAPWFAQGGSQRLGRTRHEAAQGREEIARISAHAAALEEAVASLKAELASAQGAVTHFKQESAGWRLETAKQRKTVEHLRRERDHQLVVNELVRKEKEAILTSTAWKLTAPLRAAMSLGKKLLRRGASPPPTGEPKEPAPEAFRRWLAEQDDVTADQLGAAAAWAATLPSRHKLTVVIDARGAEAAALQATQDSIAAAAHPALTARPSADGAIDLAEGDYVLILKAGDRLHPLAPARLESVLAAHPDAAAVYGDSDVLDAQGRRADPWFKPDWSPELFLDSDYVGRAVWLRVDSVAQAGLAWDLAPGFAWRAVFALSDGAQASSAIRHSASILVSHPAADLPPDQPADAWAVLAETVQGRADLVPRATPLGGVRLRWRLPDPPPRVTAIIPTKDKLHLLKQCVDGLAPERTEYPDLEILIVDNRSEEPETLAYFKELEASGRAKIIRYDAPFNFADMNNVAAAQATGSVLALLNNDIEPIDRNWLKEMVSLAIQPEVGAVGAKLLYPDDRIQHAGVIMGLHGGAAHAFRLSGRDEPGYARLAQLRRTLSAVTAACLVVRKELFDQVGGMNAEVLKVAFNDIDFCLKLGAAGQRCVWTPDALLYHHESASRPPDTAPERRAQFEREATYFLTIWADVIEADPYYSPNLDLIHEIPRPAFPPRRRDPWGV